MTTRQQTNYAVSAINGKSIAESVHKKEENKNVFLVSHEGKLFEQEQFLREDGATVLPVKKDVGVITKGGLRLPTGVESYGDEETLFNEIREFIHDYVDVDSEYELFASAYVLISWTFERFDAVPYLRVIGDYGTGKSRFLQTIGALAYKQIVTDGATTLSPIFRMIDEIRGTLIFDEADMRFSNTNNKLIKLLNAGYKRGSVTQRSEGQGVFDVKYFNTYGPKVIATREYFDDEALESRCLTQVMGSHEVRKDIPRTLGEDFYQRAEVLRNKLLMYRFTHLLKTVEEVSFESTGSTHARLNQILLPIYTVGQPFISKGIIEQYIASKTEQLNAMEQLRDECDIVRAILVVLESEDELLFTRILEEYQNLSTDFSEINSAKKIGYIINKKLRFETKRTSAGHVIVKNSYNQNRLVFLAKRFGIDEGELDAHNEHNEHPHNTPITEEELGEIGKELFG